MSDIHLRYILRDPEQARTVLAGYAYPWIKEQLAQGRELVGEYRLLEDSITDRQRAYLHGVVLTEIAKYGRANGEQFPMRDWKEYFRKEWLGFKTVTYTDPITGKKHRRRERISTEDLGVRGMAEYIDRVTAFASTELGLTISEPLPPELRPAKRKAKAKEVIDADTGEITEAA